MGAFVLGVLIGWLAEWLFYTFWVKAGDNQGDCSAIKAELELKNRQITSLQTQLASATENSVTNDNVTAKTISSETNANQTQTVTSESSKSTTNIKKSPSKVRSKAQNTATSKSKKAAVNNKPTKKPKAKNTGDDFTKLSGIGPSMSATLKSLGIDTFKKLADSDDDKLRDMLESAGAKMNNNKEAMDSWNEQATLADKGDFVGLKKMQEELKK